MEQLGLLEGKEQRVGQERYTFGKLDMVILYNDNYLKNDLDLVGSERTSDLPGIVIMDDINNHQPTLPSLKNDSRCSNDETEVFRIASKFINRSLFYRLFGSSENMERDSLLDPKPSNFDGEFRKVSIVLVKIKIPTQQHHDNPDLVVKISNGFIKQIESWKGTFQQFSVNDTGKTLLGLFGLPVRLKQYFQVLIQIYVLAKLLFAHLQPCSFEKQHIHAIKAANAFLINSHLLLEGAVAVSIATGEILFSRLGNNTRSEASLLGDAVNLAARLLALTEPNSLIVCDEVTYNEVKSDVRLSFKGEFSVKGTPEPVQVWSVDTFQKHQTDNKSSQT
jgi:class 3 adenylate cyclase